MNPINLSGFYTSLVSLLGNATLFPVGALLDPQYRSRRAKKCVAIDAIRVILVRNLDPIIIETDVMCGT